MTFTISIRNWDRFQHRDANRSELTPPWIKDYTRQLSDDDWVDLTYHQRGLLQSLRLEYARAGRNITGNTAKLSRRLGHRVTRRDLDSLHEAGFIDYVTEAGEIIHTTPIQRRQNAGSTPADDREDTNNTTTQHTISLNQAESGPNVPAERQHDAGLELNLTERNSTEPPVADSPESSGNVVELDEHRSRGEVNGRPIGAAVEETLAALQAARGANG